MDIIVRFICFNAGALIRRISNVSIGQIKSPYSSLSNDTIRNNLLNQNFHLYKTQSIKNLQQGDLVLLWNVFKVGRILRNRPIRVLWVGGVLENLLLS